MSRRSRERRPLGRLRMTGGGGALSRERPGSTTQIDLRRIVNNRDDKNGVEVERVTENESGVRMMAHHVRHRSECPAQPPWVAMFVNSDLSKTTLATRRWYHHRCTNLTVRRGKYRRWTLVFRQRFEIIGNFFSLSLETPYDNGECA